jgi:PAS domain S-box-containing protein
MTVEGRVAHGASAQHYETKRIHKDGSLIDVAMTVSPIRDSAGTIVGTSTIQRNITQRKQTETVTAEMAAIVDSSNDAIIGMTLDGVITTWNRSAEHIYGYGATEMVGQNILLLVPAGRPVEVDVIAGMLAGDARTESFETSRSRKDGQLINVSLTVSPIRDSEGRIVGASSVARDVTENVAIRAELIMANAELVEANRHKTLFLANMSHELRTPLNSILGFSELLIDPPADRFPPETRIRFLNQIHTSGQHLLALINDLLDISKVEAGQMELRLKTVSVSELVNQVASTVEPLAAQKHIHLELDVARAGELHADEAKVKQMILNLVSNAIKFTPDGGTVTITAYRIAGHMEIAVIDTGIGIGEQDLPRMFKEFQQVDSGVNRTQKGTGLGLALTRNLARLHGGDVRVVSTLGKGSRFTIDLPIKGRGARRLPNAPALPVEKAADDPARPLVIVVEDDPAAAELLARQIDRAGFRTEIASTGAKALVLAQIRKPVAITVDIMLPDMDGWEILKRLKKDEVTNQIPAVVVSVVDNPELGAALGALDYLVKPLDTKELVHRLSKINLNRIAAGGRTCVLVVDDEPANRAWLKEVLEPAGFDVALASTGREAIELAKSSKPDVVVLDLMMPEMDGFDVVDALSGDQSTQAIPIVVLTAKQLTIADHAQLNDRVANILRRGSTGAVDLIGELQVVLSKRVIDG